MFEEQITESIEAGAPNITYSGNEGPKSPQDEQRMKMAQLEEAYEQYVYEMIEMGNEPMSIEQFLQQVMAEGQMSKGPILPSDEDPINPFQPKPQGPVLPDRQMAAYGGIMGMDGRRQYGIGSSLKKFVRKVIPNEVAEIAVKAAPFVAPFNPLAAGLMSGIGSFDQTGRIGSSLKSGLMNYGLGQGARYLGGAGVQTGINPMTGSGVQGGKFFSSPMGNKSGLGKMFSDKLSTSGGSMAVGGPQYDVSGMAVGGGDVATTGSKIVDTANKTKNTTGILQTIKDFALDNKLLTGLAAGTLGMTALMGNMEEDEIQDMQRGEGLDIEGIRAEVREAMADDTGQKLKALRSKYPFLGRRDTKDYAMGGRIGKAEGGLMDLGGMEKDYRAEGGFVPIGREEKADDVPARLSVNEFVFTADAVRNAGGGDIDQGAEVMERVMKNLEQGGQISEETQGMSGAQEMFNVSERLSEVV